MTMPVDLEREPHLQYRPGIVANIDRHPVLRPLRTAPDASHKQSTFLSSIALGLLRLTDPATRAELRSI